MEDIEFEHENPVTVHDILWSWSRGYMTTRAAVTAMGLDDVSELFEAADDNEVPYPGRPSQRDVEMAEEFLSAIASAA